MTYRGVLTGAALAITNFVTPASATVQEQELAARELAWRSKVVTAYENSQGTLLQLSPNNKGDASEWSKIAKRAHIPTSTSAEDQLWAFIPAGSNTAYAQDLSEKDSRLNGSTVTQPWDGPYTFRVVTSPNAAAAFCPDGNRTFTRVKDIQPLNQKFAEGTLKLDQNLPSDTGIYRYGYDWIGSDGKLYVLAERRKTTEQFIHVLDAKTLKQLAVAPLVEYQDFDIKYQIKDGIQYYVQYSNLGALVTPVRWTEQGEPSNNIKAKLETSWIGKVQLHKMDDDLVEKIFNDARLTDPGGKPLLMDNREGQNNPAQFFVDGPCRPKAAGTPGQPVPVTAQPLARPQR